MKLPAQPILEYQEAHGAKSTLSYECVQFVLKKELKRELLG